MNHDARYLIRLAHDGAPTPAQQAETLAKVREIVTPIKGRAINLRVSPSAFEFDLFIAPTEDVTPFTSQLEGFGKVLTVKRLDVLPGPVDAATMVDEARALFNDHRYWEVHEVLEGLWKSLQGTEKNLVQGLIIAAAALVHVQKDEWTPVWTMLEDAERRLKDQPGRYYSWDIATFRDYLAQMISQKKVNFPTV